VGGEVSGFAYKRVRCANYSSQSMRLGSPQSTQLSKKEKDEEDMFFNLVE